MSDTNLEDTIRHGTDDTPIQLVLVFWPEKVYDLANRLQWSQPAEGQRSTLVGKVVHDQAPHVAVVIYGLVSANQAKYLQLCGLSTIGICNRSTGSSFLAASSRIIRTFVWIIASCDDTIHQMPILRSVRVSCPTGQEVSLPATVVRYTVPNSRMLQYFAMEPLRLGPVSGMRLIDLGSLLLDDRDLDSYSSARRAMYGPSSLERNFFRLMLMDPVRWRKLKRDRSLPSNGLDGAALRLAIDHINQMQYFLTTAVVPSKQDIRSETAGESASSIRLRSTLVTALEKSLLQVKAILNCPIGSFRSSAVRPRPSLASLLASAHQLDVRLSQLLIVPRLASRLRHIRKSQRWSTDEVAAPYIGLWNAVWLIANDVILGHVISLFLLEHKRELADLTHKYFEQYFLHALLGLLTWLGDWPAGLKLNTELSLFFGDAYTSLTGSWNHQFLSLILSRLESSVVMIAFAGRLFGVTMVICLLQDLLAICTLHVTAFYLLSLQMMRFFVYVLSALFDLFRGKKRNALRGGRLDNASYELDQLLLGTTLFTLVAFLFPTVYVYYLAFGLLRFSVVGFEVAVMETCLGLLNHLPLFALMLRVKDPHRLPAGIYFEPVPYANEQGGTFGNYRMRTLPLGWYGIFEGYAAHVGGLAELPNMLFRCMFGQPLRRRQSSL